MYRLAQNLLELYTYRLFQGPPDAALTAVIFALYEKIFGQKPGPKVAERLTQKPDIMIVMAYNQDNEPIGHKIGYAEDESCFYSWLGGVLPECRGSGLASAMMDLQHDWCRSQGYRCIRTKTMNRWRNMLILNLKKGFDIESTCLGDDGVLCIILCKLLS